MQLYIVHLFSKFVKKNRMRLTNEHIVTFNGEVW
jgi:hypothetical protein